MPDSATASGGGGRGLRVGDGGAGWLGQLGLGPPQSGGLPFFLIDSNENKS